MENVFKTLVLDEELVKNIKNSKLNEGVLYNHLISGKITLQEYLVALQS